MHTAACRPPTASAAPTADEVFRSVNDSVAERTDYGRMLPWFCGAAGLVILLVLFSHRQKRQALPKPLNHNGKLTREVSKALSLRPGEVKQLKLLAEEEGCASPLTLLLCPSILKNAAAARGGRADRKVIAQVAARVERGED